MTVESLCVCFFFFSRRRRDTRFKCDWSSDVCSSDLLGLHISDSLRMFTAEGDSHSPAATRQRNDPEADFRCGGNPQRGESSWAFRLKICDPSPVFLPPATCGIATNSGEKLLLLIPQRRALM